MPLNYVGRNTVSQTNDVATKKFSDDYGASVVVDQAWVDAQVAQARSNRLVQTEVLNTINALDGSGNRLYPTRSQVQADQALYLNAALLGQPATTVNGVLVPGVAQGGTGGMLAVRTALDTGPGRHIPSTIKTDNVAVFHSANTQGTTYLTSSYVATGNSPTEYRAATFTVPDPGYAYYPMNFVSIRGKSGGTSSKRVNGATNMGMINVSGPVLSNGQPNYYAYGTCSDSPYSNWYAALPAARISSTGTSTAPSAVTGDLVLNLYLSNYQGSGYTFYGGGLVWTVMVMPVVGN